MSALSLSLLLPPGLAVIFCLSCSASPVYGQLRTQFVADPFAMNDHSRLREALDTLGHEMKAYKRAGVDFIGSRGKKSHGEVQKKLQFIGSRGKKAVSAPLLPLQGLPYDFGYPQLEDGPFYWNPEIPRKRGIEFLGSRGRRSDGQAENFDVRFGKRGPTFLGSRG